MAVLRSQGYYKAASFDISAAPVPASATQPSEGDTAAIQSAAADTVQASLPGSFAVTVKLVPGPQFTLEKMTIESAVTVEGLDIASLNVLNVAADSTARAVAWLNERGYPYAHFEGCTVTADFDKHT